VIKLKNFLKERTGSKVLDYEKLDSVLKNYVKKNFDFDEDYVEEKTGVEDLERGFTVPEHVSVKVPPEIRDLNWEKFFKKYGYYVATADRQNDYMTTFKLYPYDTEKIENPEGPLYHITPVNKLLKIKEKGLVPKKSSKRYKVDDSRVYFVRNNPKGNRKLDQLIRNIKKTVESKPPFGDRLALLEIDPSKTNADFYKDFEIRDWGVYTRDNISPKAIKNIDKWRGEIETLKKRKRNN